MRYYKLKVLCSTDESRQWEKMHPDEDISLDMLVTRPMYLSVENVVCFYPHKDKRATSVDYPDGALIVAMRFEEFEKMVFGGEWVEAKRI